MSAICGEKTDDMWKILSTSARMDYGTATYLLLLDRKLRGLSLKLCPSSSLSVRLGSLVVRSNRKLIKIINGKIVEYIHRIVKIV